MRLRRRFRGFRRFRRVQRVVGKVLKIDRPIGRRVLKFDGPTGRGLWYRPAGDEFYNSALQNGKPNNRASPDGNAPLLPTAPLHGKASHVIFRSLSLPYKSRSLATGGSMSLDSQVALLPYESSSFATPEGEVCSMLNINLIRCEQHFGD